MNIDIVNRLNEMAEANGGRLTPDDVVAEAKLKNSRLWRIDSGLFELYQAGDQCGDCFGDGM